MEGGTWEMGGVLGEGAGGSTKDGGKQGMEDWVSEDRCGAQVQSGGGERCKGGERG